MKASRTYSALLLSACLSISALSAPVLSSSDMSLRIGTNVVFAAVSGEKKVDTKVTNPLKANSIEEIINNVINFIFTIAVIVCPLVIIAGGFIMITAGGEPDKVGMGRRMIYYALIGLGVIILAKGFVLVIRQVLKVKESGNPIPFLAASGSLFKRHTKRLV